jgi:hypothetical protein
MPPLHFLVDMPEPGTQYEDVSFYCGTPTVILKNQLFEPSSAMRPAVEELNTVEALEHLVKEIMVKYTDGGPRPPDKLHHRHSGRHSAMAGW